MSFLYDILFILFLLFSLPRFIFRLVTRSKYRQSLKMRLGFLQPELARRLSNKKVLWLHAVSLGEMIAASSLLPALRREFPDYRLVISTTTETGQEVARQKVQEGEEVIYFPLDISFIVRRLIKQIKPAVFLVMETEIWPNVIHQMAGQGVKIALINGRVSPRSYRGYRCIRWLMAPVLRQIDLLCMQTEGDAEKIISLGPEPEKVKVTGNIKFDQAIIHQPAAEQLTLMKDRLRLSIKDKLLVAGSTHPGEEKILLEVYQNLRKQFSDLKLLIAPRHIERTAEVERLVKAIDPLSARYTDLLDLGISKEVKIIILDTIGLLREIYSLATVVFVGGSLVRHGGHNMLEPAALAKPVVFGPYVYNFQDIADLLLASQAVIMVNDKKKLEQACRRLLSEPEDRQALGHRARIVVEQNTGAVLKNIELIKGLSG